MKKIKILLVFLSISATGFCQSYSSFTAICLSMDKVDSSFNNILTKWKGPADTSIKCDNIYLLRINGGAYIKDNKLVVKDSLETIKALIVYLVSQSSEVTNQIKKP